MAMVDTFVILSHVQFEKNGYQNRYMASNGKWVTKPIKSGTGKILAKEYTDGLNLLDHNMRWILQIKETLGIKANIVYDQDYGLKKTENLIANIKHWSGNIYITNPEAKDKYLDEELMTRSGIRIEYCQVPRNLQKHTFDIFAEFGIEGAKKLLPRRK
jgi:hypothetical protein